MTGALAPLVVDLDGTLTPTDTMLEAGLWLARHAPHLLGALAVRLFGRRAVLKSFIASHVRVDAGQIAYRDDVLGYLRQQRAAGRRLILATGSHHLVATAVATHLQLFDEVIATQDVVNLTGVRKLAAIRARVAGEFVYAGDSAVDLAVWREAAGAVLVGVTRRVGESVRSLTRVERDFPQQPRTPAWMMAIRGGGSAWCSLHTPDARPR